ncbi:hypothetical protein [Arthrobacter sp.]|uniref:hypothetical protein n=1 Tax=Arthrobacter sp. TaxID=1667 RepID=UPI00289D9AB2|nr:hypothetical protein [Arthrobacter sp.]
MEFVVIVLFVAAIVLVNFLVGRAQRRRASRPATPERGSNPAKGAKQTGRAPAGTSLEAAREAVARLDEAGHQQVYAAIAQGQPIRAIQVYAQATGCGIRAASAAVASLASHPVPYVQPKAAPAADAPTAGPVGESQDGGPSNRATGRTEAEGSHPGQEPADAGPDSKNSAEGTGAALTDGPGTDASAPGGAGKDTGKRNNSQTLPDEAEISKWAQNLRPEDF